MLDFIGGIFLMFSLLAMIIIGSLSTEREVSKPKPHSYDWLAQLEEARK
jgi:hypothetical protein